MATLFRAKYPEPVAIVVGPGDSMPEVRPAGEELLPRNGKFFKLAELQDAVGGYIEISEFPDGRLLVFNEEGKLNELPVNIEATIIYRDAWRGLSSWAAADTIVGDAVLCNKGELR